MRTFTNMLYDICTVLGRRESGTQAEEYQF